MVRNRFICMNISLYLQLYDTFVRQTAIEYASVCLSPMYKNDITATENVQWRTTKLVPELKHFSNEKLLMALGMPNLINKLKRADMFQLFKILNIYESVNLNNLPVYHK